MQAFRQLPANLVSRLAADCSHVRLPANTLLFEEDSAGNAMWVGNLGLGQHLITAHVRLSARTHTVKSLTRKCIPMTLFACTPLLTLTLRHVVASGQSWQSWVMAIQTSAVKQFKHGSSELHATHVCPSVYPWKIASHS